MSALTSGVESMTVQPAVQGDGRAWLKLCPLGQCSRLTCGAAVTKAGTETLALV